MQSEVRVPIFNVKLLLSITDDVVKARRNLDDRLGIYLGPTNADALASSNLGLFVLFYHKDSINHGVIAHEIFHMTHRIIDYVGGKFKMTNQEQHAYLCEWITNWVYKEINLNQIILTKERN